MKSITTTDAHGREYEAVLFPLVCPDTNAQCHTLCACYLDGTTSDTRCTRTAADMLNRTEGDPYGRCLKYGIDLMNS